MSSNSSHLTSIIPSGHTDWKESSVTHLRTASTSPPAFALVESFLVWLHPNSALVHSGLLQLQDNTLWGCQVRGFLDWLLAGNEQFHSWVVPERLSSYDYELYLTIASYPSPSPSPNICPSEPLDLKYLISPSLLFYSLFHEYTHLEFKWTLSCLSRSEGGFLSFFYLLLQTLSFAYSICIYPSFTGNKSLFVHGRNVCSPDEMLTFPTSPSGTNGQETQVWAMKYK